MSLMGNMAALGHTVAPDEILKNSFANQAFENFEIASYTSLITMAEAAGYQRFVPALQQTLAEEHAMAKWCEDHIASTTLRFLQLSETGTVSAKV